MCTQQRTAFVYRRLRRFTLSPVNRVILIMVLFAGMTEQASDTVLLFQNWTTRLNRIANEIKMRLNADENRKCECSVHACGRLPNEGITECLKSGHNVTLDCGVDSCGHMRFSTQRAYVRVSPFTSPGSYLHEIKRDICLTQGLEKFFKDARGYKGGFAPSIYFGGSESGIYVGWPGKPREADSSGICREYDPRVEDWWRQAAWHRRNIVILVDLSQDMTRTVQRTKLVRWDMTVNIVSRFLQTLSEEDNVQIIGLSLEPKVLMGPNATKPATQEVVQRLTRQLKRQTPDKRTDTIDIGKGLRLAFDLLNRAGNAEIATCESHILLFSSRRDCSSSIAQNCASKVYVNETGVSATQPVNATIGYVKSLIHEWTRNSIRSIPSLFTYSLSHKANSMLSQLTCHLGGIHVDLERELERTLDPLQLMRGYFRKTALTIVEPFRDSRIFVGTFYPDPSGLGQMHTLAMPVFYQPRSECPAIHYGVIGADVLTHEYVERSISTNSPSFDMEVHNWNKHLSECHATSVSQCHLQVLREKEAQCVYPLKKREDKRCYRFKERIYHIQEEELLKFDAAKEYCHNMNGQMIAPQDEEERRFLATVIPPDGAWINVTLDMVDGVTWRWSDGMSLNTTDRKKIERKCDYLILAVLYMDPRNYDDNIQCVQKLMSKTTVCWFDAEHQPDICSPDIVNVTQNDFKETIKTCGLEDCLLTAKRYEEYTGMKETSIFCNGPDTGPYNFSKVGCCSEEDLIKKCHSNTRRVTSFVPTNEGRNDSGNASIGMTVAVIVVIVLGVISSAVCIHCACKRKLCFSRTFFTHLPFQSSISSIHHPRCEMTVQSPFGAATSSDRWVRKLPELVVNIDVKILDNGWEKVGGYGRVRQGEYTDIAGIVHKVAVKFVDALAPNASWEALKNEFDILATIPLHPNIVKPIGAHWGDRTENSQRYIVEELMYTNLGDMMSDSCPPPYPNKTMLYKDWIKIFMDVARGLEHLHRNKIIHFDLKPRNVLLDEDMNAKIADFGCSKAKFDTYIELSEMAGTPPYLAPECWMRCYAQNVRTEVARVKIDVYSFGVIMWECLNNGCSLTTSLHGAMSATSSTVSPVQPNSTDMANDGGSSEIYQQWELQYRLNEEIPKVLRVLVTRCVRFEFDSRPTCRQILDTLQSMLEEEWANRPVP